jgi:hypothetical protein
MSIAFLSLSILSGVASVIMVHTDNRAGAVIMAIGFALLAGRLSREYDRA